MLEERPHLWVTLAKSFITAELHRKRLQVSLWEIKIILLQILKIKLNKQNENKKIIRTIDTRQKPVITLSERSFDFSVDQAAKRLYDPA